MSDKRPPGGQITPQLAALLALRFRAQDKMKGIQRITPRQAAMLGCCERFKRQQTEQYAQAVYLRSLIEVKRKGLTDLIDRIHTGESIPDAIEQAQDIQTDIEEITNLLAKMDSIDPVKSTQPNHSREFQESTDPVPD